MINIISPALHDYLRDTLVPSYKECISCNNRTQFTCIKCGYCYSCHWKKEKMEKVLLEHLATTTDSTFLEKYPLQAAVIIEEEGQSQQEQEQQEIKVIDVFGQQTEPICSYHTCHHKFSIHGHSSHVCKCLHPFNYATGVSISSITTKNKDKRKVLQHYD